MTIILFIAFIFGRIYRPTKVVIIPGLISILMRNTDRQTERSLCVFFFFLSLADIFSLFASESGSYATLEDIEAMLQAVDGEVHPSLRKCFTEVGYLLQLQKIIFIAVFNAFGHYATASCTD